MLLLAIPQINVSLIVTRTNSCYLESVIKSKVLLFIRVFIKHEDFQVKTCNLLGLPSLMDDLLRLINLNNLNPFLRPLINLPIDSGGPVLDVLLDFIIIIDFEQDGLAFSVTTALGQ